MCACCFPHAACQSYFMVCSVGMMHSLSAVCLCCSTRLLLFVVLLPSLLWCLQLVMCCASPISLSLSSSTQRAVPSTVFSRWVNMLQGGSLTDLHLTIVCQTLNMLTINYVLAKTKSVHRGQPGRRATAGTSAPSRGIANLQGVCIVAGARGRSVGTKKTAYERGG